MYHTTANIPADQYHVARRRWSSIALQLCVKLCQISDQQKPETMYAASLLASVFGPALNSLFKALLMNSNWKFEHTALLMAVQADGLSGSCRLS